MSKQSSPAMSSLAARILKGYEPSPAEIKSLAACVLSLDQTKGQGVPESSPDRGLPPSMRSATEAG